MRCGVHAEVQVTHKHHVIFIYTEAQDERVSESLSLSVQQRECLHNDRTMEHSSNTKIIWTKSSWLTELSYDFIKSILFTYKELLRKISYLTLTCSSERCELV